MKYSIQFNTLAALLETEVNSKVDKNTNGFIYKLFTSAR